MFTQKVIGSQRVQNNLRAAAAASENTYPITRQWAQDTRKFLKGKPYPPKLPFQRYVRTGRLANSWKVAKSSKNAVEILNTAHVKGNKYAVYVVGDTQGKRQAGIHKGRWWLARPTIEERIPDLKAALLEDIVDKGNGE